MREKQQPYIPTPVGVWQLSQSSLIEEAASNMLVTKNDIGIDPLWTPAGFIGSPLLSPLHGTLDSHLIVDYKPPTPSWPGITVACWLRFDDSEISSKKIVISVSTRGIDIIPLSGY